MLNLKRHGCLAAYYKHRAGGRHFDMFFVYVDHVSLDRYACAQNSTLKIYRAITQTSRGGISIYYKGRSSRPFKVWCAEPKTTTELVKVGLNPYIAATTPCDGNSNQRFNFGKFCWSSFLSKTYWTGSIMYYNISLIQQAIRLANARAL